LGSWLISTLRYVIKFLLSILLEVLYYAASLCIDAVRTFHLIVLAILGPFVLAFSCYDGFQQSISHWLAKYINVYLWLPIASIFGAILNTIQANMLQLDIARAQSQSLQLFSATDIAYLIFLLMGIVGYLTVPSLANYIVHSHIPNPIQNKIMSLATTAVAASTGGASGAAAGVSGAGAAAASSSTGGSGGVGSGGSQYNMDKISGQ
jgi:conjugative transposon TraJ protein